MANAVESQGIAIVFATSGYSGKIVSVDNGGQKRAPLKTTHLATTADADGSTRDTFYPSKLIDEGELKLTVLWDALSSPTITAAPETITITYPIPPSGNTASTMAGSGFVTELGDKSQLGQLIMQDITIKKTAKWTRTAGT